MVKNNNDEKFEMLSKYMILQQETNKLLLEEIKTLEKHIDRLDKSILNILKIMGG